MKLFIPLFFFYHSTRHLISKYLIFLIKLFDKFLFLGYTLEALHCTKYKIQRISKETINKQAF